MVMCSISAAATSLSPLITVSSLTRSGCVTDVHRSLGMGTEVKANVAVSVNTLVSGA